MSLNAIFTGEVLERINRPTAEAIALPNAAYTAPEVFAAERERIFCAGWAFAACGAELAQQGDALPLTVCGLPLLLVRGGEGRIRAFHNVCRHRGAQLIAERASGCSALSCRYHGWTYGLDGALLRTPHVGGPHQHETPGIDRAALGLAPVRCESWHDLVFVNIGGAAPPLAQHLAPLARRWAAYDLGRLRHGGTCHFEAAANWKLVMENFLESYHLPFAHPGLETASRMQAHYTILEPLFLGQGTRHYDAAKAGFGGLPSLPGLSAEEAKVGEYPTLMPNLMLGLQADHMFVFAIDPVSPERTRETFHFYYVGAAADGPAWGETRAAVATFWRRTNQEDIGLVEAMQAGRRSPGYRDARFSPYHETATHEFQRRIANLLAGARQEAMSAGARAAC